MRRLVILLAVAGLATFAGDPSLEAQASPATQSIGVAPGTRVRVRSITMVAPLIANFLHMSADTAVFIEDAAGRGIWSIQVGEIRRLERSIGERRMNGPLMVRWGLIGAGAGAVSGLVVASTFKPSDDARKYDRLTSGLVGAGIGAVIGTIYGGRKVREAWTEVPIRRVTLAPTRNGVSVGAALRF